MLFDVTCWLSLGVVVAVWLLIRFASDRWWPATVLLYGPRWVWAAPAVLLAPFALLYRRRMSWVLAVAVILAVGPVMGLCLSWPAGGARGENARIINVLSCNVEGAHGDSAALFKLIERSRLARANCTEPGLKRFQSDFLLTTAGKSSCDMASRQYDRALGLSGESSIGANDSSHFQTATRSANAPRGCSRHGRSPNFGSLPYGSDARSRRLANLLLLQE